MAPSQDGQQNQAGRHQEVGHKSLLQSDNLYQVIISTSKKCEDFIYLLLALNFNAVYFITLQFFFVLFLIFASIYLKPVFIRESLNPWKSSGRWQQNIHGEIFRPESC